MSKSSTFAPCLGSWVFSGTRRQKSCGLGYESQWSYSRVWWPFRFVYWWIHTTTFAIFDGCCALYDTLCIGNCVFLFCSGPVNSILFIDGNKKFVSTSDDKKVIYSELLHVWLTFLLTLIFLAQAFYWEYGIPVVNKHIAEPDMHSMPYTALHPSGKCDCNNYFQGNHSALRYWRARG